MNMVSGVRSWRACAVAAATAVVLAGCGFTSDGPRAPSSTTPAPPRTFALGELEAALPGADDVPNGSKATVQCPGKDDCPAGEASVTITLAEPAAVAEDDQAGKKSIFADQVLVTATVAENPEDAAARLKNVRDDNQKYAGDFDIAPVENKKEKSYTFGEKGTGSVEDVELATWSGLETTRRSHLYDLGDTAPNADDESLATTTVLVVKGRTVVMVTVSLKIDDVDQLPGPDIARQVAQEYLQRLG